MANLTFSFSQCLRHAFMSGAGYGDLDKISEEDQRRFCDYDPPKVGAFQRIVEALSAREPKTYDIGDRTLSRVFKAAGLTDVSDMQAVFDAVEKALPPAAEPADSVTNAMLDSARHLMMWLDFGRPTERALLEHCRRLGKTPPPECRDVDHVPPKALRLFWIYREMEQARRDEIASKLQAAKNQESSSAFEWFMSFAPTKPTGNSTDQLSSFRRFVDLIEGRAMACDGPVTPFVDELHAASDEEKEQFTAILRELYASSAKEVAK